MKRLSDTTFKLSKPKATNYGHGPAPVHCHFCGEKSDREGMPFCSKCTELREKARKTGECHCDVPTPKIVGGGYVGECKRCGGGYTRAQARQIQKAVGDQPRDKAGKWTIAGHLVSQGVSEPAAKKAQERSSLYPDRHQSFFHSRGILHHVVHRGGEVSFGCKKGPNAAYCGVIRKDGENNREIPYSDYTHLLSEQAQKRKVLSLKPGLKLNKPKATTPTFTKPKVSKPKESRSKGYPIVHHVLRMKQIAS